MSLLRFLIALALPGIMGMIGLGAMAYGGLALFTSTKILSAMSAAGEHAPVPFLISQYGFHVLIFIGGLGLLVFAAMRIAHRIRMGLPTAEEGVGKSPVSRFINIVIYGAGFCFGAYSLAVSAIPGIPMALLVLNGVTTTATITGFEPTSSPTYWIVRYQFRTLAGQTIADTTFEDGYAQPSTRIMKTFKVTYIPSDPAQHDVTESYSHSSFILFMVVRLGIALVGLWGVVKNIVPPRISGGYDDSDGDPELVVPPPAAPMAVSAPVLRSAGGPRPTFGRRSA